MKSKERNYRPISGYIMLFVIVAIAAGSVMFAKVSENPIILIMGGGVVLLLLPGFFVVNPNNSKVLVFFGAYKGTVKQNGLFWINPLLSKQTISLRARNFDSERVKVNDKIGNPIMISVILVWRVKDTYRAAFEVDYYAEFVKVQSDAAVRKMAGMYPYDDFNDIHAEVTLRSGVTEVNQALEQELSDRLSIAGIEVMEARIGYLAYATEIASAMLRRQQATAIVAARQKIVEGAVGMVEMALEELSKKNIIHLDEEKKAAMVSNLMVVLCSEKDTTPVINTGTLNQ